MAHGVWRMDVLIAGSRPWSPLSLSMPVERVAVALSPIRFISEPASMMALVVPVGMCDMSMTVSFNASIL